MPDKGADWKQIPLLQLLTEPEGEAIQRLLQRIEMPEGRTVFRARDRGEAIFFILSGKARITFPRDVKGEGEFEDCGPGEFFGEVACFDDVGLRTATVTAIEPLTVCTLRREDLLKFLREHPDAALPLLSGMAKRLRRSARQIGAKTVLDVRRDTAPPKNLTEWLAKYAAEFAGSKWFFALHGLFIALWIAWNLHKGKAAPDPYPFNLLGLVITTEALLFSAVVLMNQTREAKVADKNDATQHTAVVTAKEQMDHLHERMTELETHLRLALPERKPDELTNHAARK